MCVVATTQYETRHCANHCTEMGYRYGYNLPLLDWCKSDEVYEELRYAQADEIIHMTPPPFKMNRTFFDLLLDWQTIQPIRDDSESIIVQADVAHASHNASNSCIPEEVDLRLNTLVSYTYVMCK